MPSHSRLTGRFLGACWEAFGEFRRTWMKYGCLSCRIIEQSSLGLGLIIQPKRSDGSWLR